MNELDFWKDADEITELRSCLNKIHEKTRLHGSTKKSIQRKIDQKMGSLHLAVSEPFDLDALEARWFKLNKHRLKKFEIEEELL